MRIVHLCLDDKFIAFARKVYEAAWPGANRFIVYHPEVTPPSGNVSGPGYEHIGPAELRGPFRQTLAQAERLVVHYLDADFVPVVATAPAHLQVTWHAWGADVYAVLGSAAPPLYLPETAALLGRLEASRRFRLVLQPARFWQLARRKWRRRRYLHACLARFDRVSMAPAEFELLKRSRPELRAEFRHFHYNSVEDVFARGPETMHGPNILLGNSADPSNNHLEALSLLGRSDIAGRKIICPLSYGGNAASRAGYVAAVVAAGKRRFGDGFLPLLAFMPFADYADLLASCGTVVMNHVRQQAVGTIGMALYKGAGVYLRPENLARGYFRDLGCTFFELAPDASLAGPLDDAARARNRAAIEAHYAFERVVECVRGYDGESKEEASNSPTKP